MWTALLTIALGGWSYDGFVGEPTGPSPTAVPRGAPPSVPGAPAASIPREGPSVPSPRERDQDAPSSRPGPPLVASAPPTAPGPPRLWRLTDDSGRAWQHSDPLWLRRWVAQKNVAYRRDAPTVVTRAFPTAPLPFCPAPTGAPPR